MEIRKLVWNFLDSILDSNMYVLQEEKQYLVIDPIDNDDILEELGNANSVTVLLTHEHFDHICGLNKLRTTFSCKVIASKTCSDRIQDVKANMSLYADIMATVAKNEIQVPESWVPFSCNEADITFADSYTFTWMGHPVELIATPGHSPGSCCILADDKLFSGDTILENRMMIGFPGSSKKVFRKETIPLLEKLLYRVNYVYPGHGDVMTRKEAIRAIDTDGFIFPDLHLHRD